MGADHTVNMASCSVSVRQESGLRKGREERSLNYLTKKVRQARSVYTTYVLTGGTQASIKGGEA